MVEVSPKQAALNMIQAMPDDVSLEDIMYQSYFRHRIDRGLAELDQGRTVSHEEVRQGLMKWLQSSGQ